MPADVTSIVRWVPSHKGTINTDRKYQNYKAIGYDSVWKQVLIEKFVSHDTAETSWRPTDTYYFVGEVQFSNLETALWHWRIQHFQKRALTIKK